MCTECKQVFIQKPFEYETICTGKRHGNWEIQVTQWLNSENSHWQEAI